MTDQTKTDQPENMLATYSTDTTSLILDPRSFEQLQKAATIMASGKSTIPDHLRNPGDCLAIIMQSLQWHMNPYSVAQKTFLVQGKLGYEAQLVAAVINSSGMISERFRFDFFGPWEKVIGKFDIRKGDKGEYRVPGWSLKDEEGCGVTVSATLRGESEPRRLDVLLAQARTRNSTLWADDPKQQLAYLAQKKWARLYAPDVILGVYTVDELEPAEEREINPRQTRSETVTEKKPDTRKPLPDTKLNAWIKRIEGGVGTAEELMSVCEAQFLLTPEQIQRISNAKAAIQGEATREEVSGEAGEPGGDQ